MAELLKLILFFLFTSALFVPVIFSQRVRDYVSFSNKRLTTEGAVLTDVQDVRGCVFSCTRNEWCLSINFRTTPEHNGLYLCELLSVDQFTNGTIMESNDTYIHYSQSVSLFNSLIQL